MGALCALFDPVHVACCLFPFPKDFLEKGFIRAEQKLWNQGLAGVLIVRCEQRSGECVYEKLQLMQLVAYFKQVVNRDSNSKINLKEPREIQ